MTTWTEVASITTSYDFPAYDENDYVLVGYVEDGYLTGDEVWTVVNEVSTTWTPS